MEVLEKFSSRSDLKVRVKHGATNLRHNRAHASLSLYPAVAPGGEPARRMTADGCPTDSGCRGYFRLGRRRPCFTFGDQRCALFCRQPLERPFCFTTGGHSSKAPLASTSSPRPAITTAPIPWRRITDAVRQLANETPPGPLH
jgi:hypothetical protein